MATNNKKDKVVGSQQKKNSMLVPAIVLGGVLIIGAAFFTNSSKEDDKYDLPNVGTFNTGVKGEYTGQVIDPNSTEVEFKDGKIYMDLEDVKAKKFVRFAVPNQVIPLPNRTFDYLPVIAYIAPSGRLVTAVGFCEPCSGTEFRIQGQSLICNACDTVWNLEDLKGISGGCPSHPPDEVDYEVVDGKVVFDEATLRGWEARPI